jgi:hypothetical protein
MKVENYAVQPGSVQRLEKSRDASERKAFWTGSAQPEDGEAASFVLDIEDQAYQYAATQTSKTQKRESANTQDQETEVKLRLIETLVYQMTGKRVKLQVKPARFGAGDSAPPSSPKGFNILQERDKWGLTYEYQETFAENESISFNSGGAVATSDGKSIMFSLEFNMSRSYYEQNRVAIRMGNAVMIDPLMMAMNGGSPAMGRGSAGFDLDGGDGAVGNDGALFGLESDGFTELRAFDLDRNGWIDEADDVFSRLSMLTLSDEGEKTLVKLADVGVGAIYLNEMETPFATKDTADSYGEMRSSSVYLREDGSVGTIHHFDMEL